MRTLIAGHDSIEFGWVIATWIPAFRKKSRKYDKVIAVCKKENKYLYRDFVTDFEYYAAEGKPDRWLLNKKEPSIPSKIVSKYPGAKIFKPSKKVCTLKKKEYFMYGTNDSKYHYDIVIHARALKRHKSSNRNWPVAKYQKVLKLLRNSRGMSACSIGSPKGSFHVPGTTDLRGIGLFELCNILRNSSVCVGSSSGPMHLASFCGCPHVVITGNEERIVLGKGMTNRHRYKKLWNPFKIKCKVLDWDKWNPPVEAVRSAVERYLT